MTVFWIKIWLFSSQKNIKYCEKYKIKVCKNYIHLTNPPQGQKQPDTTPQEYLYLMVSTKTCLGDMVGMKSTLVSCLLDPETRLIFTCGGKYEVLEFLDCIHISEILIYFGILLSSQLIQAHSIVLYFDHNT